ncbi:hypothetical protein O6H91_05G102700 [Diphasiastrum complanatum]|uniref:Uncharacterized protein n=1 Tax=Diphasiastrum complanatum TaxID=34168 RepID=A0ACC2DRH9_DIPCM|nr:hypothetical protein O6H91_05G102700 [Diphasiastrum complanatum]
MEMEAAALDHGMGYKRASESESEREGGKEMAEEEGKGMGGGVKGKGRELLIAVDDSEGSSRAVDYVLSTIAGPADSITLLHVRPELDDNVDMFYGGPAWLDEVEKKYIERSEAILNRFEHEVKQHQINCKTLSLKGDPRIKIVEAVKDLSPDLLIIGSRGHGKIKRVLLGSISDYAAHHAECSVLIVKSPSTAESSSVLEALVPGMEQLSKVVQSAH